MMYRTPNTEGMGVGKCLLKRLGRLLDLNLSLVCSAFTEAADSVDCQIVSNGAPCYFFSLLLVLKF